MSSSQCRIPPMPALRERLATWLAGRDEDLRELGAGGMGIVYLVHAMRHGRDDAINVLCDDVARSVGADRLRRHITVWLASEALARP